jgi:hypothetical protein
MAITEIVRGCCLGSLIYLFLVRMPSNAAHGSGAAATPMPQISNASQASVRIQKLLSKHTHTHTHTHTLPVRTRKQELTLEWRGQSAGEAAPGCGANNYCGSRRCAGESRSRAPVCATGARCHSTCYCYCFHILSN